MTTTTILSPEPFEEFGINLLTGVSSPRQAQACIVYVSRGRTPVGNVCGVCHIF